MEAICAVTKKQFTISDHEAAFCQSKGIPLPTLSGQERLRQLFTYRNEWQLFSRPCSKTGKNIISCYRPDTTFPVYDREVWLDSNSYDPFSFGRPYDFSRPFFEQYHELSQQVPRIGQIAGNTENSPYVNLTLNIANCYFTFSCLESQDCMYGVRVYNCRDCIDNLYITFCELCYQCINCHHCYNLKWSRNSTNCRESAFLYDCRSCSNCFGCVGLEYQQYCIWNVQYTKEEYENRIKGLLDGKNSTLQSIELQWHQFLNSKGHNYNSVISCEDCSGSYLQNSHQCQNSYFLRECEQVDNGFNLDKCRDCYSCVTSSGSELMYMNMGIRRNCYNVQFSYTAAHLSESQYTGMLIYDADHLFGCVSINRKASYCILNRQYTKEEYEELVPRIIAHMKSTSEYGQFFPMWMAEHPYRDSIAQEFFPLSSEGDEDRLNVHKAKERAVPTIGLEIEIPDDIALVDDSICNQTVQDKATQQAFRYQKKEIAFYKAHHIPLPAYCFESRHLQRSKQLVQFVQ
jgi:hypothetical protein